MPADSPAAISLYDLQFHEVEALLADQNVNPVHAAALWRLLYRPVQAETLSALPRPLRTWLQQSSVTGTPWNVDRPEVIEETHSADGLTRKFLLQFDGGHTVETVLMGYAGRHTVCVSSQVGCAMGCVFCATGQMGFSRNLRSGEIVTQVLHAQRVLHRFAPEARIRNVVMMGMGEPLDNYDAVMSALAILTDPRGLGLGPSRITLSTVGVVPGIQRMIADRVPYSLAVSLHGSTEAERRALVPASRRWPLDLLIETCRTYCRETKRRIFFEWTLIEGGNDSPETAARLAALLQGLDAHVNLIPLNPTNGFHGAPSRSGQQFQQILRQAGLPCTFRQRRGIDVAAGCGMLKAAAS